MSSAPAVAAYVVASLACSAITGGYMSGRLPTVMQHPAVQSAVDRTGRVFADFATESVVRGVGGSPHVEASGQPEPDSSGTRGDPQRGPFAEAGAAFECPAPPACDCAAEISAAHTDIVVVHRGRVVELEQQAENSRREVWQWQMGTFFSVCVGAANWIWGFCSSRKLRAKRAEQLRISHELSDVATAISPARERGLSRRVSEPTVPHVAVRYLRRVSVGSSHGQRLAPEDSGSDSGSDTNCDPIAWPEDVA
jgi:hypothetical protein